MQAVRLAIQIIFFIFLPSIYIGTLSGIQQIYLAMIHQSFSASLLPQIVEVAAVIAATIIFGRFFCGWMCGFGAFTDFIYLIFRKLFPHKPKISEKTDAWMKYIKYGILLVLAVAVWTFNAALFSTANPWDVFGMLVTVGKAPDFSYVLTNLTVGFIIFLAIAAISAVYERFFCRYLCPLGAVFSLISKLRIAKIKKPSAQCGSCKMCTNRCAMGIPLYKMESVRSGECINCMKCVTSCPRGNAKLMVAESDVRPLVAGTAAAAIMTGIYYGGTFAANAVTIQTSVSAAQSRNSNFASRLYKDGIYQGSGTGFRNSTTTVSVTISGDKITAVNVDSYGDDQRFFDQAFTQVSQEVLSSQSADVDAVSGATFSSKGIMSAVSDALSKAKLQGSVASSVSGSSSSSAGTVSSEQNQSDSSQAEEQASQADSQASESSGAAAYKDGTYKGTGNGFRGETAVTVTVSGGKITSVNIDSYQDDDRFFQRACPQITQEIVSSQSADVDAVSGATFSSKGIMQAVANALQSAVKL